MNYTINDILDNADVLGSDYAYKSISLNLSVSHYAFPCNITNIKCFLPNLDTDVEMPLFPDTVRSQGNAIASILKKTIIKTSEHTGDSFKIEIRIPNVDPLTFTYTNKDPVLLVVYAILTRKRRSIKLKRFAFMNESELVKGFDVIFPRNHEYKPLNIGNGVLWDIFDKSHLYYKDSDKYSNSADFLLQKRTEFSSHYFYLPTIMVMGSIPEERDLSMTCINLSYFIRKIPKYGTGITRAVLSATISALCMVMRNMCSDKVHVDIRTLVDGCYHLSVYIGGVEVYNRNIKDDRFDSWLLLSNKKALPVHGNHYSRCLGLKGVPYCKNDYMLNIMEDRHVDCPIPSEHPSIHVVEERFENWVKLGAIVSDYLTKETGAPPNSFQTLIDI